MNDMSASASAAHYSPAEGFGHTFAICGNAPYSSLACEPVGWHVRSEYDSEPRIVRLIKDKKGEREAENNTPI